jgi:hypothetical protein
MRRFSVQVFDEYISGTAGIWYSSSVYDELFGSADSLVIQAVTEQVSGTTNLLIQPQHSCNGLDWLNTVTNLVPPGPVVNDGTYIVDSQFFAFQTFLTYVRLRITLTGTVPACLLKVFVCGRASSNAVQPVILPTYDGIGRLDISSLSVSPLSRLV